MAVEADRTNGRTDATDPLLRGEQAAAALQAALRKAGLRPLPSLKGGHPILGRSFVDLGGCETEPIFELAEWIESRT
ncbi:hypothetical protein AB0399_37410 [Streptomyces sp. NPDC088194]|uniref:hypothetical protein n=1 Tax=Streptomyces sp. NPDC088194 TaxID=3154931 RepID=UPI00344E8B90